MNRRTALKVQRTHVPAGEESTGQDVKADAIDDRFGGPYTIPSGDWPDLEQWIAEARQKAQEPFIGLTPEDLRRELKDAQGANISVIPLSKPWIVSFPYAEAETQHFDDIIIGMVAQSATYIS